MTRNPLTQLINRPRLNSRLLIGRRWAVPAAG